MHFSIRKKTIVLILAFAMLLISVAVIIYSRVVSNSTNESYLKKADDLAKTVAGVVDADKSMRLKSHVSAIYKRADNKVAGEERGTDSYNEYIARFSNIENSYDFISMRDFLRNIAEINGVECVYLAFVDEDNESVVYVVDSAEKNPCPPGYIEKVDESNKEILSDPDRGFPAYETNTEEFGWLVTAGAPIYDSKDRLVGYAMTDISMEQIRSAQTSQVFRLLMPLMFSLIFICALGILIVNRTLIRPLKKLTAAAEDYGKDADKKQGRFEKLRIKTGDEIEALAVSMKKMESDIGDYINKLVETNRELTESKSYAVKMTELANRDSLTGVRNKTAYDNEVKRIESEIAAGQTEFGVAIVDMNGLKTFNDTYGHERGDDAIKALCSLICTVFSHSPVFRVGGDEFVVILKNEPYRHSDELIGDFNERIAELAADITKEPWDKPSAAIGYAAFSEDDSGVVDVFRRADKAMYGQKSIMKRKLK